MAQMLNTCLEAACAAVFLLPVFLILHKTRFHCVKTTFLYLLFSVYLAGVYAVVGLPNVTYIRFEPNIQLIPFADMLSDLRGTVLNVILFFPLGLFLPLLWKRYRRLSRTLAFGFCLSLAIELLQLFTFRATDVNDLITNSAGTLLGGCLGVLAGRIFPGLKGRNRESDLPVLIASTTIAMFLFQPFIWKILY